MQEPNGLDKIRVATIWLKSVQDVFTTLERSKVEIHERSLPNRRADGCAGIAARFGW